MLVYAASLIFEVRVLGSAAIVSVVPLLVARGLSHDYEAEPNTNSYEPPV